MGDYAKQVWVDDTGDGASGTVFTKARMDNIEEGIRVAGKKALFPASTNQETDYQDDSYGVQWVRQSDGSYVASRHVYEVASEVTALDRTRGVNTAGKTVTHEVAAVHRATISSVIQTFGAKLKLLATWGGRRQARLVMNTEAGGLAGGPDVLLLDDTGASDFVMARNPMTARATPAFGTTYQPSTTRATLVMATILGAANVQASINMGNVSPPTTRIAIVGGSSWPSAWTTVTFVVPAGYYYRLVADLGSPNIAGGGLVEMPLGA